MDTSKNDEKEPLHHNNTLRIQTENLPISSTSTRIPSTPTRIASSISYNSLNGSFTSSPVLTPSGSTLNLPSTSLTPLPSPLSSNVSFPALEGLALGQSPRRKGYGSLGVAGNHGEKRNITEFIPMQGGMASHERSVSIGRSGTDEGLRREEIHASRPRQNSVDDEIFELEYWRTKDDQWERSPKQYIKTKSLGRGTFSKVVLAEPTTSEPSTSDGVSSEQCQLAIKVVHLDATDDAPAERITSSAKRELDILKKINHPCITRLLAYNELPEKCLFGLHYSQGGDLFDFASKHRSLLTPPLVKQIFLELACAVQYVHETMHVVHRDLKLENVLLNYRPSELIIPANCTPPLIALTDLGLSRPYDPASPLLTTRCGSTDYAAPEIMLGQPYDGRATDSWALGVILYSLLESRLPFDPPPDARRPGKVAHRIAMGQWKWYRLARERRTKSVTEVDVARDIIVAPGGRVGRGAAGEEGKFIRGGGVWEGGMEIVEGLLRRKGDGRWGVSQILDSAWLK